MFRKGPVWSEKGKGGATNRIAIRKIFDVERKELTHKSSPGNILQFGHDKYPGRYTKDQITLAL